MQAEYSNEHWQIAAAAVTGFSHEADDIPCQDSFAAATIDDWVVAVVSDGAGSAAFAEKGSQALVKTVVLALRELLRLRGLQPTIDEFRHALVAAIEHTRNSLSEKGELKNFAATLVGFAARASGGMFFHLGDGTALAASSQDWTTGPISQPENGEYANETYFFTADDWSGHLRLLPVTGEYDTWIAMSDGCMPFAMTKGNAGLYQPFIAPLAEHFIAVPEADAISALSETLKRPEIRAITGDDKTFVWAHRRSGPHK